MKIIGFSLSKISVERKEKLEGKLEIKQDIDIKEVEKDKIPISNEEVFKIKFRFNVDYSKDLAKLELEGSVILLPEKQEGKFFSVSWKDKQIPDEFKPMIFNFIMTKCNLKALTLEDEMGLPLHLPMPKLSPKKQ
jgi:hypothetical protein